MAHQLDNFMTTSLKRWAVAASVFANLCLLGGCAPERPQPTEPTLNLITGCFNSLSALGEPYLYMACLPKETLETLKSKNPGGELSHAVIELEVAYERGLRTVPTKTRSPKLLLMTMCFDGPGGPFEFFDKKKCLSQQDEANLFTPEVQARIDAVKLAYFQQMTTDSHYFKSRGNVDTSDITFYPVFIL